MSKAAILLAVCASWIVACAMGGSATHQGNADAPASIDAPAATPHDAPLTMGDGPTMPHDARPLDAFVPQDAPKHFGSAGDLCTVNSDCDANQGLCCFFFSCATGTGVGSNVCFH
ncbi:MAG: hypothetical protein ABI467_13195 [Kofleriaceae bacterium]